MKSILLAFCLMMPLPIMASSASMDGNDLLKKCKPWFVDTTPTLTELEELDMGFCGGYVSGVLDVEAMWKTVDGNSGRSTHYCKPEDVTNGQVFKILKKWLDNNPEKLHWRADTTIHTALLEAFPCK